MREETLMGITTDVTSDFSVDTSVICALVARDKTFAALLADYREVDERVRRAAGAVDAALRRRRAGLKNTIEDILIAEAI